MSTKARPASDICPSTKSTKKEFVSEMESTTSEPMEWEQECDISELTKHYTVERLSYNGPSRSWEEYLERKPTAEGTEDFGNRLEALRKLVLLRDEWRGEWKPSCGGISWCLINRFGEYNVAHASCSNSALSFPTEKMAESFLETFRTLIDQAGDLI